MSTRKPSISATKTIPNKIVTSRPSDPPWMHNEIRKLIRLRKRHHSTAKRTDSQSNWAQYRKTRNLCINKIRNARQTYYRKVADNLKSGNLSPKQWWKELKRITDSKNSKTYPPIKFDEHSLPISDNKKKADLFNAYFCSQSNVNDKNTNLPNDSNLNYVNTLPQIVISTQDVKDVLETLDTSKATGPDCINPTLLKQAASAIAQPLSKFYNLSLRTSSVPNQWKIANVIPVFKKGNSNIVSNYRPISLLSILGKCMEKCIFKYLYNFIHPHEILTPHQSGFRPNDSTVNQLLSITSDFYKAVDQGKEVRVIFFDISKAFDKVWHKGLLYKLKTLEYAVNYLHGLEVI